MASIQLRPNGSYRARYRDDAGREHAQHFALKRDAQKWLDQQTAALVTGSWVEPGTARMTVAEWCDVWLGGYGTRRPGTIRSAKGHVGHIKAAFGGRRLSTVRPSDVKAWTVTLSETLAPSTVYAVYRRFAQIMGDAVHDGIIPRNPCSRRTAPRQAKPRPYVATTAQVWELYEAFPEWLRPAILLGAFAGLRVAEAAALRVSDVDFMRGVIHPAIQYPAEELKSESSRAQIPIPRELALMLSAAVKRSRAGTVVTDPLGGPSSPWAIERAIRAHRDNVEGLPQGFRFHDLRHYFASLLIASGLDVKVVQTRLRHASAVTTLNTYGHMFPDRDETARAAVAAAIAARTASADSLRTQGGGTRP